MRFRDRKDAGRTLAGLLRERRFERPVVVGIARGGVPVAVEVARALKADFGVVVARKIGAPGDPSLAIGAITETGVTFINGPVATAAGADETYIQTERARCMAEARRLLQLFGAQPRPVVEGRTVIVVDDGVATGTTGIAAVRAIRTEGASRVVFAAPVGPPEMMELLRSEADEVVCPCSDEEFCAIAYYYYDFSPVSDDELKRLVAEIDAWPADHKRFSQEPADQGSGD